MTLLVVIMLVFGCMGFILSCFALNENSALRDVNQAQFDSLSVRLEKMENKP